MLKHLGEFRLGQKGNSKEGLEDIVARLLDAVREGEARIRASGASREIVGPDVAHQQPLLDQEPTGTENKVPDELGPEGAI